MPGAPFQAEWVPDQFFEGGMPIDNAEAHKLCSEAEYQLYSESLHPLILEFSLQRIQKRVKKAHQLCQLWSHRVNSEKNRATTMRTQSGRQRATTGYITAERKYALFSEVLERFETRMTQIKHTGPQTRTVKPPHQDDENSAHDRVWV